MCIVMWLSSSTNHMHSAYSIPHFINTRTMTLNLIREYLTWQYSIKSNILGTCHMCKCARFNKPIVWSYAVLFWRSCFNLKADTLLRRVGKFQISYDNFCKWTYKNNNISRLCLILEAISHQNRNI